MTVTLLFKSKETIMREVLMVCAHQIQIVSFAQIDYIPSQCKDAFLCRATQIMQTVRNNCCEHTIFTSISSSAQVENVQFEREIHMTHFHVRQSVKSLLTSSLTWPVVSENGGEIVLLFASQCDINNRSAFSAHTPLDLQATVPILFQ